MKAKAREQIARTTLLLAAATSLLIVIMIFVFLGKEGLPFLSDPGWSHLIDRRWTPVSFQRPRYGLLPLATGSLLVTFIATAVVAPIGISGAAYLAEVAHPAEREILKPFIELLAGIPSVVIGFFGLVVLGPVIRTVFHLNSGLTALTGSLLLALMAAPTVISVAEDAIGSVPHSYKEAALALGATRIQTLVGVTLPAARGGVIAAVMLGMGRVIGETMAVLMCTGNAALTTLNPLESVRTMTATIAAEMGEVPFGSDHYRALFCVGIVLLLATLALNLVARRVLSRSGR